MTKIVFCAMVAVMAITVTPIMGADKWLDAGEALALAAEENSPPAEATAPEAHHHDCCPPLPFHSIEGYSGGAITPLAYICNASCTTECCGNAVVSYSFLNIGTREMHVFAVTQPLFNRLEIGYAYNLLNLGSLTDDIRDLGMDPGRDNVQLHHFNLRGLLIEENSFGLPLPAVTAGVHFKYNDGVQRIDRNLGGPFKAIGLDRSSGVDFTLTASKMFPKLAFGRPLILTGGVRFSQAAQIGLFGFGDTYHATFEGSAVYMPTNWLTLGYEIRTKPDPYGKIPGLVGKEDNWRAFSASWIVNSHLTVSAVYGMLGNVGNAREDNTLGMQLRWEF
ncbi:MAG: DUF3034 family protein [Phycisphaerae bacterium]|jgi:hypothetical protein|nr:DUF3034 family protein [Phycisphaerae bacterium]